VLGDLDVVTVPLDLAADVPAFRAWLRAWLDHVAPTAMYLDVFPAGILGELCDFPFPPGFPIYHLARLLRWPAYHEQMRGSPPRLALTYLLEPLASEHEQFLRQQSSDLLTLRLDDPPAALDPVVAAEVRRLTGDERPLWLVVHSGQDDEIEHLLAYAGDLRQMEGDDPLIMLIAPRRPAGAPASVVHLDLYPAAPLFPLAGRIITACGFNVMRQAAPYWQRHAFLPFARRFDDQFARAAHRRAASA
jgi:hypothetical protein